MPAVKKRSMPPAFHWQYSALNSAPGSARQQLTAFLEAHGQASLVPVAALLVSELVTNSLLHGGEPIDVRASLIGSVLRVDVDDTGDGHPEPRDPDLNGRGLRIVDNLATAWGISVHGTRGTTAWFELPSVQARDADPPPREL